VRKVLFFPVTVLLKRRRITASKKGLLAVKIRGGWKVKEKIWSGNQSANENTVPIFFLNRRDE
jgi:hypothetical protein